MDNFFYRFDFLNLQGGNKRPGFVLSVSTKALVELQSISTTADEIKLLLDRIREELKNSGILVAREIKTCGIDFLEGTACPIGFTTGGAFGANLVGDPDKFLRLSGANAVDILGPELRFTPHNIDQPKHALALLVVTQQWTEWAAAKRLDLHLRRGREAHAVAHRPDQQISRPPQP